MAQRFIAAGPAILHASHTTRVGFWHVYEGGRIRKMWP
jgi:hypothetical protein